MTFQQHTTYEQSLKLKELGMPQETDDHQCVRVPLTQGYVAVIDSSDAAAVLRYKWHANHRNTGKPYAVRIEKSGGTPETIPMHRFLLGVTDPKLDVDHINGDGLDNRRCNLRVATRSQNGQNKGKWAAKQCVSRFKGVAPQNSPKLKTWQAYRGNGDGGKHYIGTFRHELAAAAAYNASIYFAHGEFARMNPLDPSLTRAYRLKQEKTNHSQI